MSQEHEQAALRDALQATLQSHQRYGKAAPCDCSLCHQIRDALAPGAGVAYRERLREECARVADWVADQLTTQSKGNGEDGALKMSAKTAREIAARIRLLDSFSV